MHLSAAHAAVPKLSDQDPSAARHFRPGNPALEVAALQELLPPQRDLQLSICWRPEAERERRQAVALEPDSLWRGGGLAGTGAVGADWGLHREQPGEGLCLARHPARASPPRGVRRRRGGGLRPACEGRPGGPPGAPRSGMRLAGGRSKTGSRAIDAHSTATPPASLPNLVSSGFGD